MKKIPLLLSLGITAFFFACGDDSASNANGTNGEGANSNTSSQGTEIPCDAGSEGIILKPIDSDSYRLCSDGKWVVVEPDKPAEEASSSSTKSPEITEESSSSVKVAEPDDESSSSVKDPEPDEESSSSAKDLEPTEESSSSNEESKVFLCDDGETYVIDPANCAKNSSSSIATSSSTTSSSSVLSSSSVQEPTSSSSSHSALKDTVVKSISIMGSATKGPFKFGSLVKVYELHPEDLGYRTGRVYNDEISSNQGHYVIPKVTLLSPYAELTVEGPFLSEVTGKNTDSSFTLRSIVDLSESGESNINILTHLQANRILKLVEKGYTFAAAKKQAEQEVMTSFYLSNTVAAEHSTIYDNATVMAISLLFLGNRSEEELRTAIDNYISDLEKDGQWNDSITKAQMADWVYDADWLTIHKNVDAWNIVDIADFHAEALKYRNNMWGLGGCTENRKGELATVTNTESAHLHECFKCGAKTSSDKWVNAAYAWHAEPAISCDTEGWAAGTNGDIKKGTFTSQLYVYDSGRWRKSNIMEDSLGTCVAKKQGEIGKVDNTYYICKNRVWEKASALEYDTYGWSAGEIGEVKKGSVSDAKYVYRDDKWQTASSVESALGSCIWDTQGAGAKYLSSYYICNWTNWTKTTASACDTYGWKAGEDGEIKKGSLTSTIYVYDAKMSPAAWREATAVESELGGCVATNAGNVSKYGSTWYICTNRQWITAERIHYDTYGWAPGVDGELKTGNVTSAVYVYDSSEAFVYNGKTYLVGWRYPTAAESVLGGCVATNEGLIAKADSSWYICENRKWKTASKLEYDTYGLDVANGTLQKGVVTDTWYIYRSGRWGTATRKEKQEYDTQGLNGTKGNVIQGSVTQTYYAYDSTGWRLADTFEILLGETCGFFNQDKILNKDGDVYTCHYAKWGKFVYETLIDDRDGKIYKTIKIGNQTWMAENLNYDPGDVSDMGEYAWSGCYDNDPENCTTYGRFYTRDVAMNCANGKTCSTSSILQGICPDGWHLPASSEFDTMFSVTSKKIRANYWHTNDDVFGFSLLPAGTRYDRSQGSNTALWCTFEDNSKRTYYLVDWSDASMECDYRYGSAFSVRCLKD